jgi:hypothetical protein
MQGCRCVAAAQPSDLAHGADLQLDLHKGVPEAVIHAFLCVPPAPHSLCEISLHSRVVLQGREPAVAASRAHLVGVLPADEVHVLHPDALRRAQNCAKADDAALFSKVSPAHGTSNALLRADKANRAVLSPAAVLSFFQTFSKPR